MTVANSSAVSFAEGGRRLWRRRWVRWPAWVVLAVLVFWLLTWLALPPLIKWQGQKIATQQLGRPVRIGAVQFNPLELALTLRDVSIGGLKPTDPPQFAARRLYANLALESVVRLAPIVDAIQVDAPTLRLRHLGDGHYDVDDVIARLTSGPKSPPDAQPAHFALYNIAVQGGSLTFIDDPVQRTHEVRDLRLTLPFISNLPSQRKVRVTPQLAFTVDGSRFDSGAQTLPFDDSLHTEAQLHLQRLDLGPYLVYQPASLPLRVTAGALDADLRLSFEQASKNSLKITGVANLTGVKINDATSQQALAFDRLAVNASDVRPLEHVVHLASIELTAPNVLVSRDARGRLNWMPAPASAPPAATPAQAAASAGQRSKTGRQAAPEKSAADAAPADDWRVVVDSVAITQGDARWRDAQPTPGAATAEPAAVHVAPFTLQAKNVTWPAQQPASFSGRLALADTAAADVPAARPAVAARKVKARGAKPAPQQASAPAPVPAQPASAPAIEFQGQAQLSAAKVSVQARGLPLRLAGPYLAATLKPRLAGTADADAEIVWNAAEEGDTAKGAGKSADKKAAATAAPGLTVNIGKLALNHLALQDGGNATAAKPAAPRRGHDQSPGRSRGNSLAPDLPPGTLASINALTVEGAKLDLPARSVAVADVSVQAPRVRVTRDRAGRWMAEDWLADSGAAAPEQGVRPSASAPPWAVRVGHVAVSAGGIGWRDQQPASGAVDAALLQLKLEAKNFELNGRQPMPLELSAQLASRRGEPGKLSWRGTVGLAPVSAQGQLDAERLPLQAFEPYVAGLLNIDILRADASFKGKVAYEQQSAGPRLRVAGDARIEELRTTSHPGSAAAGDVVAPDSAAAPAAPAEATAAGPASQAALAPDAVAAGNSAASGGLGEDLLNWKQLRVAGLDVRLEPGQAPQVAVKDSQLSDFYARIIVHPNGRINLQDLVKTDAPAQAASAPASAPAPAAPGAAAASPNAPVMHFGPTRLVNGQVAFSDHFIRPNYSADLTQLGGSLGAFSSVTDPQAPQMADLQLTGRAQGTAQLTINGKLNPLAQPLALDIAAKVTDLELPPLSPYAVKYSGHGIERGKLSMDVAYKITPDGQLTAANKLVLNQLQFGEQVPGAPASLPVSLATTLLADSNGVIDLDLPISGSLNDPQFSIGPVIFKAIMNLIGKAITAPFTLLAHAFGGAGGSDMSQVPFAPGSATLSDAAKAQLDKVAKALTDRSKLKLTVVGAARMDEEREDYKRERLKALVAAEKRASAGADADTAAPADAASAAASAPAAAASSDADYPQLLRRLYRRADVPGKPRNLVGMTKDVPVEQMESLLLAHINVGASDIQQLATRRAVAVKDYLQAQGLSADRIFMSAVKTDGSDKAADAASSAAPASAPASAAGAMASATPRWTPHAGLELGAR